MADSKLMAEGRRQGGRVNTCVDAYIHARARERAVPEPGAPIKSANSSRSKQSSFVMPSAMESQFGASSSPALNARNSSSVMHSSPPATSSNAGGPGYGMQMHACSHVCISIGSQHDPTVGRDGVGADWRKHTQPPRTYRCHRLFRKEYVYRVRVYARVIHRNTYTCIRLQAHG